MEDNIKVSLKEAEWGGMEYADLKNIIHSAKCFLNSSFVRTMAYDGN